MPLHVVHTKGGHCACLVFVFHAFRDQRKSKALADRTDRFGKAALIFSPFNSISSTLLPNGSNLEFEARMLPE